MKIYDVFNGDADGICALVQLRLAKPVESVLITGVKRDIELVRQVPVEQPVKVNVLDVSLDKNRNAVERLLTAGSQVFYVDHHFPGDSLPEHPAFQALIDTQPTTCTSLLIDQHLDGQYRNWAITAAFGDNLNEVAQQLAVQAGLSKAQTDALCELGVCVNYNGYGADLSDLHFHPADLFRELVQYANPLEFIAANGQAYQKLREGYQADLARGRTAPVVSGTACSLVVKLPNAPWARRVSGVMGNELANANPDKACAVLTELPGGGYLVSIRAPLNNRTGADKVARTFPTGGGREAAAGINALPVSQLEEFIQLMASYWQA